MSSNRTEKEQVRVHIRWMIRRDMPEVLQTEQDSFEFAWTEEDFLRCLRQRNCIGMVAEQGEKVVGFMIYELHKAKLHILNFAVHPTCRRSDVGSQMVAKLISKLSSHRRTASPWRCAKPTSPPSSSSGRRDSTPRRCCRATTRTRARTLTSWSTGCPVR